MRIKIPILLILGFLVSSLTLTAGVLAEPFKDVLPSERTEQELTTISEPNISLRQAPDEDGYAQKEVPMAGVDLSVFLLLTACVLVYGLSKKLNRSMKTISMLALFALLSSQLSAQFQANPDNAFIDPKSTNFTPIDVLYNDYYVQNQSDDCTRSGLEIKLWNGTGFVDAMVTGTLGWARVTTDNQVEYRPKAGAFGQEKIRYQIYCSKSGQTSDAEIYVNVNDKPNMISDADCYVDPVGVVWGFTLAHQTGDVGGQPWSVNALSTPIVADIDNDGEVEILVLNILAGHAYDRINVFAINKTTKSIYRKYQIPISADFISQTGSTWIAGQRLAQAIVGVAKAKATDAYPSIFVAQQNGQLRKFMFDPMASGYFTEVWNVAYTTNRVYAFASPMFTDIMGDGRKQVLLIDKIIDADTGKILAQVTDQSGNPAISSTFNGSLSNYSFGRYGHSVANEDDATHMSMMTAIDLDGDGVKEIIGGDCVYKVNLIDYTGSSSNTYKLYRRANRDPNTGTQLTARADITDGSSVPVDLDGDGRISIVVSTTGASLNSTTGHLYVYDPLTAEVRHNNVITLDRYTSAKGGCQGLSMPFVGDIDGNGIPEICVTSKFLLSAYKLNTVTRNLDTFWTLPTTDNSASTTLSIFDFAQDGKAKLVYRDITTLRIIDGRSDADVAADGLSDRVLATINGVGSATGNEMPVIVDVNGDGCAEIIVTGNMKINATVTHGSLLVLTSADANAPWAPARPVWNQWGYNPLWINDDLTIPSRPINPATEFISPNGQIDRPFNNFLQQSTSLNKEGLMIMLGPDLVFDPRVPKRLEYVGTDLKVSVGILNQGDATFTGAISLQLYAYESGTDTYHAVGNAHSYLNTSGLSHQSPNNTVSVSYTIADIANELPANFDNLVMTVNLNSNPKHTPTFSGSTECLEGRNNFASGFSLVNGDRVLCEGSTETVALEGVGSYTIKWYENMNDVTPVHTGSSYSVTKNSDPVTHYFVECYATPGSPSPITNIRDTVFVYLAPDSLVWTGKGNTSDWHDWQNWKDPSEALAAKACVPRSCTDVQLLDNMSVYPNLNNTETDYGKYTTGTCNNIHFAHGSELVRPDMLTYVQAYVDVTFQSHRWHLFAPPLKDFYTGDLYINDIIPANDIIKTYTKYWARRNPWTNSYRADWNGLFHQPNESFVAGQALGVWISDKSISGQANPSRDPFDFRFPKNEGEYTIYIEDTTTPAGPWEGVTVNPLTTVRTNNYRFIFDGAAAGSNFNLKVDSESPQAGDLVLIGNPFMAHLDFDKFYAANSSLIKNYYVIFDENAVQQHYNKDGSSTLSKNIAPMQGFLVELKGATSNLLANGTMTLSVPGDKLRSTQEEAGSGFYLKVTASQGDMSASTYIQFTEGASDAYQSGEDIAGLYPTKVTSDTRSIMLYSQTEDGMKSSLNTLSTKDLHTKEIGLGLWSPKIGETNSLTLNVSNLNLLPTGYAAYLYDKEAKKSYDLSLNSMQTFDGIRVDGNQFVDNRFSLKFAYAGSSIEEGEDTDNIRISIDHGSLKVESREDIDHIKIFTLQGGLVLATEVHSSSFETVLANKGLYLVKVKQGSETIIRKVLSN